MARRVDKNADRLPLDLQLELGSFRVELKDLQHKLAVERCERIKLKSYVKKLKRHVEKRPSNSTSTQDRATSIERRSLARDDSARSPDRWSSLLVETGSKRRQPVSCELRERKISRSSNCDVVRMGGVEGWLQAHSKAVSSNQSRCGHGHATEERSRLHLADFQGAESAEGVVSERNAGEEEISVPEFVTAREDSLASSASKGERRQSSRLAKLSVTKKVGREVDEDHISSSCSYGSDRSRSHGSL